MTKEPSRLSLVRQDLEAARASGDPRKIVIAASHLGLAQYQAKKFKEGDKSFREAEHILKSLDDFSLKVRCLGIKTLANQIVGRLPTAFKIAQEIEAIADAQGDLGVKFDSLASQGQILIDSGDEIAALARLNAAQEIVNHLDDPRRKMNLMGAFGNYSMTIASADKAQTYFEEAVALAREIGDRKSEIGFLGNVGTILEWKGEYQQAGEIFVDVLAFVVETGNQNAEIQALRHLTQVHEKLGDNQGVLHYAQRGVERSKEIESVNVFNFYEKLIQAQYSLDQTEDAHLSTQGAIEYARSTGDRNQEFNYLISLGESYLLNDMFEGALKTYQEALEISQRIQKVVDYANLVGRIGIIHAEMGETEKAIKQHQSAVDLARRHEIPDLEGEQLSMLAMAFMDQGNSKQAREFCEHAIQVYEKANLVERAKKARELLKEIVG
jgi:tetratricopeptide (TPR) repeat protein